MTSVYAFSFKDEESEVVNKAKEIAKRNNQSFSKLVIEALAKLIDEQKNLIALDNSAISNAVQAINYINNKDKNLSLDLFTVERREIPSIIEDIDIKPLLGKLMGDARLVLSCSKRQIENL